MISRRLFMAGTGVALSIPKAFAQSGKYPFSLGVASGCPREDGVVLWTRLAPEPLKGGGMPFGSTAVRYRLCSDDAMRRTVREGLVETSDAKAHSVHVTLRGLEPGREYWYQFYYGDAESPIGRTKTAMVKGMAAKLALASCNAYESGFFAAYADMAGWQPDCVIHVGDYIYEGGIGTMGVRTVNVRGFDMRLETVRQHNSHEIATLWDYRNRYGLYKSDASLQAAHAAAPWIVAMDDHEIDNNWAGDVPQDPWAQTPLEFKVRKQAALQAYYEHMPLEAPPTFSGVDAHLQMYDAFRFGPAQVHLLDTRQYRSDQVCGDGFPGETMCDDLTDPYLTMTGAAQERWLRNGLRASQAPFNVIAAQTWFAPYRYNEVGETPQVNMDQWDGYPLQRQRLIDMFSEVSNPVVLGGDWHCAAAMRIHKDPWNVKSPRIGHNFCGTSISSQCTWSEPLHAARDFNPHVDHVNGRQRGYARFNVTAKDMVADFRIVENAANPQSTVRTDVEIHTSDT